MNSLEKEFIPYQEALALKELGFNEPCFATFHKELHHVIPIYAKFTNEDVLKAPTYSQVFRWFREKYKLLVGPFESLDYTTDIVEGYYFEISKIGTLEVIESTNSYPIYEEAELACLRKLIEIVKSKK